MMPDFPRKTLKMNVMSQKKGAENERLASEYYQSKGYVVFNVNKDFPDLILVKDGAVKGFVEVKGPEHSVHPSQRRTLESLRKLGFQAIVATVVENKVMESLNTTQNKEVNDSG